VARWDEGRLAPRAGTLYPVTRSSHSGDGAWHHDVPLWDKGQVDDGAAAGSRAGGGSRQAATG
jgi:hypothetical protein